VEGLTRRPAAVSASRAAAETPRSLPRAAAPNAGAYRGMTDERFPRTVHFRYLGRGIRDLTVDERLIARWIPVGPEGGTAIVGSSRIKLTWSGEGAVSGWIQRGRGAKTERIRFTAEHRFDRLRA
jgi:hypothetical protein